MISLLTAFVLYTAEAAWGWWALFTIMFVLETLGQIMIGMRK